MGPTKEAKEATVTEKQAAGLQMGVARDAIGFATEDRARYLTDIKPYEEKLKALAGGDRSEALAASMPVVSQISGGYDAAKAQIMNSIPPGAARDKALADLEVKKSMGIAGTEAQMVENAPGQLATLGQTSMQSMLQELALALGGAGGASTTAANIVAQNPSLGMSIFSSLAGLAGEALGGYLGKPPVKNASKGVTYA